MKIDFHTQENRKMKKQYLAMIVSMFFMLSLSDTVMAVSDVTGENYVTDVDLSSASVQTFASQDPSSPPEYIKLGIKMAPGSHLPGMIIWDFDVDNNIATGGSSFLSLPYSTAEGGGGGPFKTFTGWDFSVVMALRGQADDSSKALCKNCVGSEFQCATRGAPTSCNEGTCYELGTTCSIGDPDCYEVTTACTGCSDGPAYPLDTGCGTSLTDCGIGLLKGEWYTSSGLTGKPFERGRSFLPVSWSATDAMKWCFTLPWHHIIADASSEGADFDLDYTINNPPKFQVSVLYDTSFSDEDDFMDSGYTLNLSDYLPDSARAADGEYNQYSICMADLNGDGSVQSEDVVYMLNEFGRSPFSMPCPSCKY